MKTKYYIYILTPTIFCILLNMFTNINIPLMYVFLAIFIFPTLYIIYGISYVCCLLIYDNIREKFYE